VNSRTESELALCSIEQASALLRARKISPVELTEAALARVERLNPGLNAFLTILAEPARKEARAAEREIARRRWRGPLHGIPISLKDNFWTRGIRTTAGSKILKDFAPREESEIARRLAAAGAILIGKTNMHEFAYGITSENPHFGPARNPWNRERITGGSSGGSAAAVAAGMGLGSMGTDTGGSIRIPSALCGVTGLKPTFGLTSVAGVIPLSESLDHAGPLARSAVDVCILLEALAGDYPKGQVRPDYRKLRRAPRRFRIGRPREYFYERLDDEVRAQLEGAARCLGSLGGRVEEISVPGLAQAADAGTTIALAEATRYHEARGWFPARAGDYGDDVRGRLEMGMKVSAVDYLRAMEVRGEARRELDAVFEGVDAIIAPASPIPAPRIGESELTIAGSKLPVRALLVGTSRPANVSGHPAISIPCGFTPDGLPVGLQLIGPRWGEARLLAIAAAYQRATDWHLRRPPLDQEAAGGEKSVVSRRARH